MKILIYDCEIIKCIPDRSGYLKPGFQYCEGWTDFKGMGISVIGAWLSWDNSIRIYTQAVFSEFQKAVNQAQLIVGFNSLSFDDNLCAANGIDIKTDYDLLSEVWSASGMPRTYTYGKTRSGYKLENLVQANLGRGKSGSGELAPELWQKGNKWGVIRYLTDDILITKQIFQRRAKLIDPTNGDVLCLREPTEPIYEGVGFLEMPDTIKVDVSEDGDDIPF
ncbi:hypothetical protein [Iningainema tapete]|uniref:Uncharacterized protein n=1 Tax=Iningainema tapete BLCC-T55 TaxID=2748662 RepID=A0A8J6XAH2_9CYAN|nr:hypothetical protein [Iningainema tapete]MBD2771215.1 hypothetical protein [Iningainema tapete BLCC-T55]